MKSYRKAFLVSVSFLILFIHLNGCSATINSPTSLKEFIIGRWYGELSLEQENSIGKVELELEFDSKNRLIFNSQSDFTPSIPLWNMNNLVYLYSFMGDDRLLLEGRMTFEMILRQERDQLVINSDLFDGNDVYFTKLPSINWPMISLTLFAFILIVIFFVGSHFKTTTIKKSLIKNTDKLKIGFSAYLGRVALLITSFCVGVFLSKNIWYRGELQRILLPWDAVITLELGFIVFACGIFLIVKGMAQTPTKATIVNTLGFYWGAMIVGGSFLGLLTGALKISEFFIFGHYPK